MKSHWIVFGIVTFSLVHALSARADADKFSGCWAGAAAVEVKRAEHPDQSYVCSQFRLVITQVNEKEYSFETACVDAANPHQGKFGRMGRAEQAAGFHSARAQNELLSA